ncbi:membrane protein [Ceratobasidium sp. AG-Ba]|nr:membrane protein [Ceratobasidium sp. AG-Ba]QRW09773.1 membrane protein [Ceratobasidium sp. AG-Ba]
MDSPSSSAQSVVGSRYESRPNPFRRAYETLGFKKGYNFVLWFVFGGVMFGFALARFMCLHVPTLETSRGPGEGYYILQGIYKPAILIHIGTVLPAGIFAILQFVPQIRYKAIIVHRVLGYVTLFLLLIGAITGFILGRRALGGEIAIQTGVIFLGASVLVSAVLAYYNIKRLQIDQHRKWMLRTWFYAGSIITLRLVMIIIAKAVSAIDQYAAVWSCGEVDYVLKNATLLVQNYPVCASGIAETLVAVPARWTSELFIGSSLRIAFGPAGWIAFLTHALGVEIYIHLTPGEDARLRKVSYQRQLERGALRPGSMGTTGDRVGDNFGVPYDPK